MRKPFGTVIFCDDIREEVGGKFSYMGVYDQQMMIAAPSPFVLPKLSFAATCFIPVEMKPTAAKFAIDQIRDGETERLIEIEAPIEAPPPEVPQDGHAIVKANLNAVPFSVPGNMDLLVSAIIGDDQYQLGRLEIRFPT